MACRLLVQGRILHKFQWDDAFVVLSWSLFLVSTSLGTWQSNNEYLINKVQSGRLHQPPPPDLPHIIIHSNHVQWASSTVFYVGLWLIKLSFLALFVKLDQKARSQRMLWWTALALTLSSLVVTIIISGWQCLLSNSLTKLEGYCTTGFAHYAKITIGFATGLDIFTDVLSKPPKILPINRQVQLLTGHSIVFPAHSPQKGTVIATQKDRCWLTLLPYMLHDCRFNSACSCCHYRFRPT